MPELDWVNSVYFSDSGLCAVHKTFQKHGYVQLQKFFTPKVFVKLQNLICKSSWKQQYLPDVVKCSFAQCPKEVWKLFFSPEFKVFVEVITGFKSKKPSLSLCRFSHADYSLLNDKVASKKGILFEVEFSDSWNESYGGFTSVFRKSAEIVRICPPQNTLTIIRSDKKMQSFVKYVNHRAGTKKRVFIRGMLV